MIRLIVLFCAFSLPVFLNAKTVSLSAEEIICRSDTIVLAKANRAYLNGKVNSDDVEEVVVQFDVKKRWFGKSFNKISLVSLPTMSEDPTFVVGLEYVLFLIKNKWVLYRAEVISGESGLVLAPDEYNEVKFRLSDLGDNIATTRKKCKKPYEAPPSKPNDSSVLTPIGSRPGNEAPPSKPNDSSETKHCPASHSCEETLSSKTVTCNSMHIAIGKVIEATSLGTPEDGANLKVVIEDYWRGSGEKVITLEYFPKKDKKWRLLAGLKYIFFMQYKDGKFVFPYDRGKFLVAGDDDAAVIYECPLGCPLIKELSQYKREILDISRNLCKQA